MYRDEDVDEYEDAPACYLHGGELSEEDEHDSAIVGTLPRCRSCILSVAPEMQTAEQIARAA